MAAKDQTLVRQTLQGQLDAYGVLVERYSGLVFALILERVRRPDEIEDLVQETFCTAYQSLPGLRRPSRFAPWLAQIARHTALRWVRQEAYRARAEEESGAQARSPFPAPDHGVEHQERAAALWEALDRLPEELRHLVVLHHLEGCSYREMARFLGSSVPRVRWQLVRAEHRLTRQVAQLLGAGVVPRPSDRRRIRGRVLAALSLGLPLAPRSDALLLPWWSVGHLLSLLTSAGPTAVAVGGLVGAGVLYLGGSHYLTREYDRGLRIALLQPGPPPPPAPAGPSAAARAASGGAGDGASSAEPSEPTPNPPATGDAAQAIPDPGPASPATAAPGTGPAAPSLRPERAAMPAAARDLVRQLRITGSTDSTTLLDQLARQNTLANVPTGRSPLERPDSLGVARRHQAAGAAPQSQAGGAGQKTAADTPSAGVWPGQYAGYGTVFIGSQQAWFAVQVRVGIEPDKTGGLRIEGHITGTGRATPGPGRQSWLDGSTDAAAAAFALLSQQPLLRNDAEGRRFSFQIRPPDSRSATGEAVDPAGNVRHEYSLSVSRRGGLRGQIKVYQASGPGNAWYLAGEWELTLQQVPAR